MKRRLLPCLFFLLLSYNNLFSQCPLPWVKKADFIGIDRIGSVGFSIGAKGYLGTGYSSANTYLNDFWEYDPLADIWTQKANFSGVARFAAVGFSINDKGYVGTGYTGMYYPGDFREYDPLLNTWTQKANFSQILRHYAVGFSIGAKGYLGTGNNGNLRLKDFWEYNPITNLWTQKADFGGTGRLRATGFSIGSKGYIGTGQGQDLNNDIYDDFWEYDTTANIWTQKADFGGGKCYYAASFSINYKAYVAANSDNFWEYDPVTDTWTRREDYDGLALGGKMGFSVTIDSKVYLGASSGDGYGITILEYDPSIIYWKQIASMNYGRHSGVSFTINSRAYVGTGDLSYIGYGLSKDFWEFDPSTNIWTQKADFGGTARWGAVGFSIGEKGFIGTGSFTGNGYSYTYFKDFWEYDLYTNSWTKKADFGGNLRTSAVGFAIGNKGYIGVGNDGTNNKKDFWEYDTLTNSWNKKSDFGGDSCSEPVGFSIISKGYIGTSCYSGKEFWEYNPLTDSWTQKMDYAGNDGPDKVGFSIGNKGYIGTGSTSGNQKEFWEYNPENDNWTQLSNFVGSKRSGAVAFSVGNKGYIGTGYGSENFKDFWEYTPCGIVTQIAFANSVCTGFCDGNASVNASGGASPYSYLWSSGETTSSVTGLCIGTYTVTITDDNGLSEVAEITVLPKSTIYLNTLSTNADCFGTNNGNASVSHSGGLYPFSYQWSNYEATASISNLSAGTFYVTVSDGYGCFATDSVIINQPDSDIFISLLSSDVKCFGGTDGSANAIITGGISPFNFYWSTGDTNAFAGNLTKGTYFITVTDDSGCSKTDSVIINQPLKFNVNLSSNNVSCNGENDGTASVSVSGATSPYTFFWSNSITDSLATNLSAETYSITVTDSNGCSTISSVNITEPPLFFDSFISEICNGDSAFLQGTYQITSGTYYDSLQAINGCDSIIQTTLSVIQNSDSTLNETSCNNYTLNSQTYTSSGTYTQTLMNADGCDSTITLNLTINQSSISILQSSICSEDSAFLQGNYQTSSGTYYDTLQTMKGCDSIVESILIVNVPISIAINTTNDHCGLGTGSATANANGGSGTYTFLWSNGQTVQAATGLSPGLYYTTVTDAAGCSDTSSAIVYPDMELLLNIISYNASCFGSCDGSGQLVVSGLIPPNYYLWSNEDTSQIVINLCAGTYAVTVTDSLGCAITSTAIISEPPAISLSVFSTPDSGNSSGTADITAGGGIPPYFYYWSNGGTSSSVSGLLSSLYFVTVTDANGCSTSDSVFVDFYTGEYSPISKLPSRISIYPNPNNGKFIVRIMNTDFITANYELIVYNLLVEVVHKSKVTNEKSEIDLKRYGSGVYNVQVVSDLGILTRTVVVE